MRNSLPTILLVSIMLTAVALGILLWNAGVPFLSDSFDYMRDSLHLRAAYGLRSAEGVDTTFPPGYPVAIRLFAALAGQPDIAARLVSLVTSALTFIPLFLLASHAAGRKVALISCLLYAMLPLRAEASVRALSEPLCLLIGMTALAVWVVGRASYSLWRAIVAGLLIGLGYLTRPEALIYLPFMLLYDWCRMRTAPQLSTPRFVHRTVLLCACTFALMLPYLVFLHAHTGRWQISGKTTLDTIQAYWFAEGITPGIAISPSDPRAPQYRTLPFQETLPHKALRYVRNWIVLASKLSEYMGGLCLILMIAGAVILAKYRGVCASLLPLAMAAPMLVHPLFWIHRRLENAEMPGLMV